MATLNEDQKLAFMDVLAFINDPNKKFHRISGGAGTGKSFFISKIVDDLLRHKSKDNPITEIAITATTNKAAAVLSNAMPHKRTQIGTIYSFMNLRVHSNFSTGEQKIVPTRNWDIKHNTFIIVDEASMVDKTLMGFIEKGTANTCKVLFVGDKNQLAPVKESLSPVYANAYGESLLNTPVRNSEQPALMALCKQCVKTVETGIFEPIKEVPGVIDYINGEQLKGILEREYSTENALRRIMCYTNKRVIEYNQYIKQLRGYTDHFNIGEIVVNNSAAELITKDRLYTDQVVEIIDLGSIEAKDNIIKGHEIDVRHIKVKDIDFGAEYEFDIFADPEVRTEVLRYFSSNKIWDKYYKYKDNYPDLRATAASTTHKAQGSTYESVIVDLADIGTCTNKEQTARMLYVAMSRPKSRLYIKGKLPDRYFK